MSWLKKHWRKLLLLALGAAGALTGEHTIYKKYVDPVAIPIVNQIPCTPGEVDCPAKP